MFAVITASFGSGFHHGYNFGVLNIPTKVISYWRFFVISRLFQILQSWINETINARTSIILGESKLDKLWQITKFLINIGAVFGGLSISVVCNKYGPKSGLLLNNVLASIATILMAVSKYMRSIETFFAGRFLIGINNGLTVGLCPMYITEIAPVSLRGAFGTFYHLFMILSYFLSEIFSLPEIFGNDSLWPILFVVPIFIIIFQVVALCFCVESPRYLMIIKSDPEKAEKSLKILRKQEDVSEELKEIKEEIEDVVIQKVTFRTLVTSGCYRFPLYIVLFSMLAQQLTGINAVKAFTQQAFLGAGFNNKETVIGVVATSALHCISALTAVFTAERLGRKYSLLYGFGGMAIDNLFLAISMFFTVKTYFSILKTF